MAIFLSCVMTEEPKPTPVIAAKLRGPGPGRYKLPSTCGFKGHDFTQNMKPAYSFGKRLGNSFINDNKCSPGPMYCIESRFTRHGRDGTPHYSILGRPKDLNVFRTPGPGKYENEKVHPQGERHAPKHSMGSRTRYRKCDSYPASNSYGLPSLLGSKVINKASSASYSMTGRSLAGSFAEDLAKTPGSARYSIVDPNMYRKRAPRYSMLARRYMPGDKTTKPGPGAHYPEMVSINRPRAPHFSTGIRHSEYITPLINDSGDC
ncbi:unnamed protein product [Clavelina lepadiformis]|uniref:Outer dense fiber protein 3 n=1 Tax=Clavelina lepadiformis TaxID=159417 RepID=A0ABP0GM40_CLALP